MKKITNKEIDITIHPADGFTLFYLLNNTLIHKRYIGYSVKEAKRRFKEYVNQEATK
jgi:hypothetical protein